MESLSTDLPNEHHSPIQELGKKAGQSASVEYIISLIICTRWVIIADRLNLVSVELFQ